MIVDVPLIRVQKSDSAQIRHGKLKQNLVLICLSPLAFLPVFFLLGTMTLHEEPSEIMSTTSVLVRPSAQHRTNTLGPTSPIQDWEVERATMLRDYKECRERAERLEQQIQESRDMYEKNRASILREMKMKETMLEKRIQDAQNQLMDQITDMQRQLTQKDHDYEEQMEETKRRYEDLITAEQQRHERRLAAMQERLSEAQQQQQQQQQNDPISQSQYEQEIEKLRDQLSQEKAARAREAQLYQTQLKQKQSEPDAVERLKRANAEQVAQQEAQVQRMREMFMRESQEQAMHQEARIQNLQSEHADALKEARDQLETEREVWQIETQAALDQVRRQIQDEKEEEIQRINREWQGKMLDIQTSMSKDASAIQQHWSGKLKELEEHEKAELDRLKGEIEVVKDRLGNEIQKRHRLQAAHSALQQREHSLKLESRILSQQVQHLTHSQQQMARELEELRTDYRSAHKTASELLSLSGSSGPNADLQLEELLQQSLRNVVAYQMTPTDQFHSDLISMIGFL